VNCVKQQLGKKH